MKKTNKEIARDKYINWRENYIAHNDHSYSIADARKNINSLIKIYIEENSENKLIELINNSQMYILEDYIEPIFKKNKKRNPSKNKSLHEMKRLTSKRTTNQVKRKKEPNPYMKYALHSESDLIKNQHLLPCKTCGYSKCDNKNNC